MFSFFLVTKFQAEIAFNYEPKEKKSHFQRLLPDELLILWGFWSGSHECVKYPLAYFALLPPNLFVSIWSYWASILQSIHFGLLARVVSLNLVSTN